jgi:type VI secretion system protein ImpA
MPDGRTINLESFLAPISGAAACGIDLRDPVSQSTYTQMRDARREARDMERKADEDGQVTTSFPREWGRVLELTQGSLTRESKDLEVACWLLEALVRIKGFAGLRDSLALLKALISKYWGSLHSVTDEEGMASFLLPITSLNGTERDGTLIQPLKKIPMTAGGSVSFAAYHHQQALVLGQVTDKATRERRLASGIPTLEAFEQAVRASPKEFRESLWWSLVDSLAELEALRVELAAKCGDATPPLSKIRETLEATQDILRPWAPAARTTASTEVREPAAGLNGNGVAQEHHANGEETSELSVTHNLNSREEALHTLAKVSAYFRATEPHSPIAFALDDLIRRARMTLPELLAELLPDVNARRTFLTSAGIKPDVPPPAASAPAPKS